MIYVEDELIKLNGVVLPGLVKSIEVIETAKAAPPSRNRQRATRTPRSTSS